MSHELLSEAARQSPALTPGEHGDTGRSAKALLAAAAVSVIGLAAGGILTGMGMGEWYQNLAKPPWQPPAWAFSAAWTAIFTLKAIAVWLVARRGLVPAGVKLALVLYGIQLVFNIAWSAIFFALKSPTAALAEIVILDVLVLTTIVAFYRISRVAAATLVPYAIWLALATAINVWIVAHLS